jgi:hypothetical protein
MCITERRKGLVHISLFDRGWPSGLRRGPTVFEGHGCGRSVTPSDGITSLFSGRSNVLAMDFSDDFARQGCSTCRATYAQQSLDRQHVPVERTTTGLSDLAQAGGCCGMIPPLVDISGSDLWLQYEFAARYREGGTLGQTGDRVDRRASACRPMCVAIAQAAVPRGLHTAPRHRRPVPIAAQLTSTTECAGRRAVWRTGD